MCIILHDKYAIIDNIKIFDYMLDHENIFRKIKSINTYVYNGSIYEIYFYNHFYIFQCNSEQLFLTKNRNNNLIEWKKIKNINENYYIGMIINNNDINPYIYLNNENQWFALGYYISSSNYKKLKFKFNIYNNNYIYIKSKKYGIFKKNIWINILNFIDNNYIPEWIQDSPINLLKIFICGYELNKNNYYLKILLLDYKEYMLKLV